MQLRLSFVLLGISVAASARPIVVLPSSQVLPTDLASTSTSTSAFASASTSPHTIITPVSVLNARQIYVPYLEDRSPAVAAPLITRAAKDPSSQIEEAYEHRVRSSLESRAETRGNVEPVVPISKRDWFEWMGRKAGQVTHNPGLKQIGGGLKTIGGEIGNKAKQEDQKMKNAYNNAGAGASADSGQPQPQPQRRQEANSDVENSSIVQGAERIVKEQQQMKEGANHLKHMFTDPFHRAHDQLVNGAKKVVQKKNDAEQQMVNGAKNVEQSTVNGVKGAANSVANVGKGAVNGFKGAVNGAEQGYQEGSNAGNSPAPPT